MIKIIKIILFINLCLLECLYSQTLPKDRQYQWSIAGNHSEIEYLDTVLIKDLGLIGDGIYLNDDNFKQVLNKITKSTVIIFPEGIFKFSKTLNINSNIKIVGKGWQKTKFIFDNGGSGNLISISGAIKNEKNPILKNLSKNDSIISNEKFNQLKINDFIIIKDNDSKKITSDWAKYSSGQICQIKNISDSLIRISSLLRRDYFATDSIFISKISPIESVILEGFSIERLDSTVQQTSNINFDYAINCKVKCIKSNMSNFAHIDISNSSKIQVEDSYFELAFAYGGGGQGYGVIVQSTSGECLLYNNIFNKLRHSMILQSGANGNVIAYNYSINPYWAEVSLPSNSAGDMCLHGNYPYANLFEGNICQNIVIDNSHGINGPDNTFFRNRAELFGIFMNSNPSSNQQNFIGNEITNSEFLKGLYILSGSKHFEYGNNIKGTITPANTKDLQDSSYYLNTFPDWYYSKSKFPPIGIPNKINQYSNQAKQRFFDGKFTECEDIGTNIEEMNITSSISISPNPASDYIIINVEAGSKPAHLIEFEIFNIFGEKIQNPTLALPVGEGTGKVLPTGEDLGGVFKIDISNLPSGVYFIKIGNKFEKFVKM
jgi:hypothetical protein